MAWLQTTEGFPISVRLSEIGAVLMSNANRRLQREWHIVEHVVSMVVEPFPWDEVESFAAALQAEGFRLLPCQKPKGRLTYDFQEMRKATQNRSMDEMIRLEKQALVRAGQVLFEIGGLPESAARDCLARVAYKMPFKCRFVTRRPNV